MPDSAFGLGAREKEFRHATPPCGDDGSLAALRQAIVLVLEEERPSLADQASSDALSDLLLATSSGYRRGSLAALMSLELGGSPRTAWRVGAAVEFTHAASLILDDLPSMDDAAMRRDKPPLHARVGEAPAILAAVALINRANAILSTLDLPADWRALLVTRLSDGIAAGCDGQLRDLIGWPDGVTGQARLEHALAVHGKKTSAVFSTAVALGAISATGGEAGYLSVLCGRIAFRIGLIYQVHDDWNDFAEDRANGRINVFDGQSTVAVLAAVRQLTEALERDIERLRDGAIAEVFRELAAHVAVGSTPASRYKLTVL